MNIKFVFFGTDDFSVIVLEQLKKAGFPPALIVTVPDHPKGRGLLLTHPPAKLWALRQGIPILQPETLDSAFNLQLTTYNLQLGVVASYGLIIPKSILIIPKHGTLNVHPSLLPKYRGATPIESQILSDEKEVGVTIMLMDEKVDHGPLLRQRKFPISNFPACQSAGRQFPDDTQDSKMPNTPKLRKMLAEKGGKLLAEAMPKWVAGEIEAKPQDDSQATYTKKFTKAEGEIDLNDDSYKNFLKIRAFDSPYFFAEVGADQRGKKRMRVIVKDAKFENEKLLITRVIPEGKKEMSYEEFLRGYK